MSRREGSSYKPKYDHVTYVGHSGSGYGSTATKVRYFGTQTKRIDSGGFSIQSDSTDATRFTVIKAGIYAMGYWDSGADSITHAGITKNSSNVAVEFNSVPSSEQLVRMSNGTAGGVRGFCSIVTFLDQGDIIRCQGEANTNGTNNEVGFYMTRLEVY